MHLVECHVVLCGAGLTETQAAMLLGKYMQELKVWAQSEVEAAASQKTRFLTGGSESSLCEEIQRARAPYCEPLPLGTHLLDTPSLFVDSSV